MDSAPCLEGTATAGLFQLPNEVLLDIAPLLAVKDLRCLSRVNRRLRSFANDYLLRYRYTAGLLRLPNDAMLKVARHLDHQRERSRLARVSPKFYSVIMTYIVRCDVQRDHSSLLIHAAKRNQKDMVLKILRFGGNINTKLNCGWTCGDGRFTPLSAAAYYGHKEMVLFFLQAGASQFVHDVRSALARATDKGYEQIALLLSQELRPDDIPETFRETILQTACNAGFAKMVRELLDRGPRATAEEHGIRTYSAALHQLLDSTACKGEFVERKLLNDVHQITLLLLDHNADPDTYFKQTSTWSTTAREAATWSPDPRIRNLLFGAKVTSVEQPKGTTHKIAGLPWKKKPTRGDLFQDAMAKLDALEKSRRRLIPFGRAATEAMEQKKESSPSFKYWDLIKQARSNSPSGTRVSVLFEASKAKVDLTSTRTQQHSYRDFWAQKTGGPTLRSLTPIQNSNLVMEAETFPSIEQVALIIPKREFKLSHHDTVEEKETKS